jgi:hypothetical protein
MEMILSSNPVHLVSLGHDLGIERGLAVARSFQIQLAELTFQSLGAFSVARIPPVVARRIVLLIISASRARSSTVLDTI